MADIRRRFGLRHLRAEPTTYVRVMRRGRIVHEGPGLAVWFRRLTASVSEVPIDERELPLVFHGRTADFQDVVVQATVTFRVADPGRAVERVDFSIDLDSGAWRSAPLEQLAGVLTELAQQYALAGLARSGLTALLVDGLPAIREAVSAGLRTDERIAEIGLEVVGVRVVALRPEPELERALQTPIREHLQQEADRATFERRALAVERERAISENEMQSQIELARREERLVAQRGANERRAAEEAASAQAIHAEAAARKVRLMAHADAEATRLAGEAEAHAEAERLRAYREVSEATLLGLTLKELAGRLPSIQTLVLSPDVVTTALVRLAAVSPGPEGDRG
jgi:regulator of protease activity HflC (stomatin/prohibitin superfamily)